MRVVHVTSALCRGGAGVKAVVEALSRAQAELGAEVKVLGLSSSDWRAGDSAAWAGGPAEAFETCGPAMLGYAPDLLPALKSLDPTVVHLHGLWMYPGAAVQRWHQATGRPYVLSLHGMLSAVALGYSPVKKRLARMLFQDAVFRDAAALHVTTEAEEAEARAFGLTTAARIVPLGVAETEVPENLSPERARRVLSLGRIHPKKGLDRLIAAWAALETDFPDWELDIVGPDEGGHAAELAAEAARLNLRRVKIRGPLTGVARDRCMAGAALFALPTRSENFAMTVPESLMMEVPVISTRGAPWQGLVQNGCGWWIEQGVAPLEATLRQAMSLDDAERAEMGRRGRAWMLRDFTWRAAASQLCVLYRDLTAGENATGVHR